MGETGRSLVAARAQTTPGPNQFLRRSSLRSAGRASASFPEALVLGCLFKSPPIPGWRSMCFRTRCSRPPGRSRPARKDSLRSRTGMSSVRITIGHSSLVSKLRRQLERARAEIREALLSALEVLSSLLRRSLPSSRDRSLADRLREEPRHRTRLQSGSLNVEADPGNPRPIRDVHYRRGRMPSPWPRDELIAWVRRGPEKPPRRKGAEKLASPEPLSTSPGVLRIRRGAL